MNQPRGKLPVEPLPTAAWKRIREEVFAELESKTSASVAAPTAGEKSAWRHIAAFAAVAALAALALFVTLRPTEQRAAPGTTSRIVTAGSVTHATVGEATLEAAPETEFVATGSDLNGWTVVLERGRVLFAVPRAENRPPFRVQAGSVAVEVVGTRFTVERARDQVSVSVERGVVRVTTRGESRLLRGGERWATEQKTGNAEGVSSPSASAGLPESAVIQAPASSSPAPALSTNAPRASRREGYEAASRLEASEPERALMGYLELSRGNDAWAANSLYAAGRLELERGRLASARRLLAQYRSRFPNGPNTHEARELLERTE